MNSHKNTSLISLPFFIILCLVSKTYAFREGNRNVRCIERERNALLTFKQGLDDPSNVLSSWGSEEHMKECCDWSGITCSNKTGHVIALQLNDENISYELNSKLSPALIELRDLNILDLTYNTFHERIPSFIGSFKKLKHLRLGYTSFFGEVSDQFGNLTNLQTLDLGYSELLEFKKLDWLPRLSSLTKLDLSGSNLSDPHAMQEIMKLPSLQELNLEYSAIFLNTSSIDLLVNFSFKSLSVLNLRGTGLTSPALIPWLVNASTNLVSLDLSLNYIEGPLPEYIGNLRYLKYLLLSDNKIEGKIPNSFWNLVNASTNLVSLDLSHNYIEGPLPENIGNLRYLKYLRLSDNKIEGKIPNSFWNLSNLEILNLSHNYIEGTVYEEYLSKLNKLKVLMLSFNSLSVYTRSDWIPPFQLVSIKLARCKMGPSFPQWILTQRNVSQLDLSSAGIHDLVPDKLWDMSPRFEYLNLSDNQISGRVRDLSSNFFVVPVVDISSNNFSGPLPLIHPNTISLQFSKNLFQGPISWLCTNTYNQLTFLDLSDNQLSGEIPNCWSTMGSLYILSLANNNFSGKIPNSLGSLVTLGNLYLSANNLIGELPSTLRNCQYLSMMDVGENKIEGNIPSWIGTHLTSLTVLSLRHNEFNGSIPSNICHLNDIQILDLSSNTISGIIPQCFNNFTSMVEKNKTYLDPFGFGTVVDDDSKNMQYYTEHALVQWKRQEFEFDKSLGLLTLIDLSSNRLTGTIPRETYLLKGLRSLNLSRNHLNGRIDSDIGQMEMLEILDLSNNQLSGDIPTGLGSLNALAVLDLANNSLSGRIPHGSQLEGFNASVYAGNSELCGLPLRPCPGDGPVPRVTAHEEHDEEDHIVTQGFYISMAIGFIIALWGTLVTLLLKVSWRVAYFNFWFKISDRIYFIHHKIKLKMKVIVD